MNTYTDIKKLLEEHNIDFRTYGKNATKGWIQVNCPFDDCYDHSYHTGINLNTGIFHCWICNKKGPLPLLISRIMKISLHAAEVIVSEYEEDATGLNKIPQYIPAAKVEVKGLLTGLMEQHKNYLINRNFDPAKLIREYQIGGFSSYGRFPFRIAIPVYEDGKLVNMTARDVTGLSQQRYLSLKNEEAVMPIKSCVYNIDRCKDNILIVEGPFDAWRIGGSTVCMFGTSVTTHQILRILNKYPKNVFVLFDKGTKSQEQASRLSYAISPFVDHTEIIELEQDGCKDPADLSQSDANQIRKILKL